jgi:very-long-chain enoyl-CoA reductase
VLKGKPESIEIYSTTTIDDAKKQVAKAAGSRDYNRIAIFEPLPAGAMIKDRNALFINQKAIMEAKEILVKDLGKQVKLFILDQPRHR